MLLSCLMYYIEWRNIWNSLFKYIHSNVTHNTQLTAITADKTTTVYKLKTIYNDKQYYLL